MKIRYLYRAVFSSCLGGWTYRLRGRVSACFCFFPIESLEMNDNDISTYRSARKYEIIALVGVVVHPIIVKLSFAVSFLACANANTDPIHMVR